MRVLHICVNFHENLFLQLMKELKKKVEIQYVFHPRKKGFGTQEYFEKEIDIYSPIILSFITRLFYFLKLIIMGIVYARYYTDKTYSIIHAHTLFSDGGLAYLISLLQNKKYIVTFRSSDLYFLRKKPWLKLFARQILKNAETIIFITPDLRDKYKHFFKNRYSEKIIVIPNGINEEYFEKIVIEKETINPLKIKLLYVGSFIKRKQVDVLINFVLQNTIYSLDIVGASDGLLSNFVKQSAKNNDRINYHGNFNKISDLLEIYASVDIFTMLSYNETFGRVYIEAMSQGIPILYSKNQGVDGLFYDGEVGFAVDHENIDTWEIALKAILNDYNTISKRAYVKSREFSWDKISNNYLVIYNK